MPSEDELFEIAQKVRIDALKSTFRTGQGHLGGTFSVADILVSIYFSPFLRLEGVSEEIEIRDKLLLSKGHACLALYSILRMKGLLSQEQFDSYGLDGGLGAQLDISTPFVDWNTGSLGHAVGIGAGIALGFRNQNLDKRVVAILGDAELAEGSVWEAILFASEQKLSNLVVIVDRNRLSVTSELNDDALYSEFPSKMRAFGWNFSEIDGHNFASIEAGLRGALESQAPTLLLANTIKGKGVPFMEGVLDWHHGAPSQEQFERALEALGAKND